MGVVLWIPAVISILLLISRYALAPLWRRRPIWLRDFAAEEPNEAEAVSVDRATVPKPKTWGFSTVALVVNSAIGLLISIFTSLQPTIGPLCLLPLVPHVSGNRDVNCYTCPCP